MSGTGLRAAALVIAVMALSANVSRAAHDLEVQSGDAFRFDGQRIHIANIDAPPAENNLCRWERQLGEQARNKLAELLAAGEPQIAPTGQLDRFSRMLALVSVNGKDVGDAMIATKLAARRGHLPLFCASHYAPGEHGFQFGRSCCNTDQTPHPDEHEAKPVQGNPEPPPSPRGHH